MIINNFHLPHTPAIPNKANAVLVIYANRVLARTISLQRLQPVARWYAQIIQRGRRVQQLELVQRPLLDGLGQTPGAFFIPESLGFPTREFLNHLPLRCHGKLFPSTGNIYHKWKCRVAAFFQPSVLLAFRSVFVSIACQ